MLSEDSVEVEAPIVAAKSKKKKKPAQRFQLLDSEEEDKSEEEQGSLPLASVNKKKQTQNAFAMLGGDDSEEGKD